MSWLRLSAQTSRIYGKLPVPNPAFREVRGENLVRQKVNVNSYVQFPALYFNKVEGWGCINRERFLWEINMERQKNDVRRAVVQVSGQVKENG